MPGISKLTTTIFLLFLSVTGFAQALCGFDGIYRQAMKDPSFVQEVNKMNQEIGVKQQQILKAISSYPNANIIGTNLYEIPVIVHVIYRPGDAIGSTYNPSDASIQAMINHLNDVYAAISGNVGSTLPLRLRLAQRTLSCAATTGIERIDGSTVSGYVADGVSYPGSGAAGASETAIKNLSIWPVNQYYNIWIVWKINDVNLPTGAYIGGYANLPVNNNVSSTDGTIIVPSEVNGTSSTLPHELGHAMGLYHTFQGGDATNCPPAETPSTCVTLGDLVCDTDPVKNLLSAGIIADGVTNPCTSTPYNGAQRNIMGYGSGLNQFTAGQSVRVLATLQAARPGLMTSVGSVLPPSSLVKATTNPGVIANPSNAADMGPCNVTLNNLFYTSHGYNNDENQYYIDNTCNLGTNLLDTRSYTLTITTATNVQRCKAWIDFDNSGIIDPITERVMNSMASTAAYTHTATITSAMLSAPTVVKNTLLRMRVAADWSSAPDFSPTTSLQYGQTEDFWVMIVTALPVVFNSVDARIQNASLEVNWVTATENNNDYFIIEASKDGQTFSEIAKLNSKAINGNSSAPLKYFYVADIKTNSVLYGSLLMAFILTFGFYKRRSVYTKIFLFPVIVILLGFFACNKHDVMSNSENKKMYVRVAQVDKNGNKAYSKVVTAIGE